MTRPPINSFPDYRPCAGVALVNRAGEVFIGRRKGQRDAVGLAGHEWQMPQGGIDEGETPLEAARRELYEETNVASVSLLAEAPDWLIYDLPLSSRGRFHGRYRGQAQKWFLFRFEGEEREIDVANPGQGQHPAEFVDWRWERWEALPALVVPFKRAVYESVVALFAPIARG